MKFSKDFLVTHGKLDHQTKLISCGWWALNKQKLQNSTANFWVFVLHSFNDKNIQYVVIDPKTLYNRLNDLHLKNNNINIIQTYLWVTTTGTTGKPECWETRGLKKEQQDAIANNDTCHINKTRNFTEFLNNWDLVEEKLT